MEAFKRVDWKLTLVLRVILGALFVYAGSAKLTDVAAFAVQVQHLGLANPALALAFAHYLPFLEIACGLALFVPRLSVGATILCFVLLVVFEGGLVYGWHRGYESGCGCFGKFFGGTSIQAAFLRNLVLLTMAGTLIVRKAPSFQEGGR